LLFLDFLLRLLGVFFSRPVLVFFLALGDRPSFLVGLFLQIGLRLSGLVLDFLLLSRALGLLLLLGEPPLRVLCLFWSRTSRSSRWI